MKSSYAHISPESLINLCDYCIKEHQEYAGDKITIYKEKEFSFLRLRFVEYDVMDYPRWAMRGCGLITRLNDLKSIAIAVQNDKQLVDSDIRLTETTFTQLLKMCNKAEDFEPYVFAGGY